MKNTSAAALLTLALASLTGCGDDAKGDADDGPTIADAVEACQPDSDMAQVETDGPDSVSVSAKHSTDSMEIITGQGAVVSTADCLVKELDGPASIGDRVANLLGGSSGESDSEDWDGFEANWSYDGSTGVFFSIDAK